MADLTISVLMPVYNGERYLDEAIRSIRGQTFTGFEFVMVNDGSTDGSLSIMERHRAADDRLIVLDRKNGGLVDALNAGLAACRGRYVARMDADDLSVPDRLRAQRAFLDGHDDVGVLGSFAHRVAPDGSVIDVIEVPVSHEAIDHSHIELAKCEMIHPSIMMRRDLVESLGGYRETFAEDYDLYLRLGEVAKLANLATPLLHYRVHAKSYSVHQAHRQHESAMRACAEARARRGLPPVDLPTNGHAACPSEDQLKWSWSRAAFASGNYRTSRRLAYEVLKARPGDYQRWVLTAGACGGPLAAGLKKIMPVRVGPMKKH